MTFEELTRELRRALAGELPGLDGQLRMAPRPRRGWTPGDLPRDARRSGVLLLLYPVGDAPHLVLTRRNSGLAHHAGQVSLPGGALEPGESREEAALREAYEEVGVDPACVEIDGRLSPLHVPVSGNVLYPSVGRIDERPRWRPDPREVDRILEVPLSTLTAPETVRVERRPSGDGTVEIPYFLVEGERVWGATAMVLAEFLCLLGLEPG